MNAIVIYAVISFTVAVTAGLSAPLAPTAEGERRAARIALTCWAWPLWSVIGICSALRWLGQAAR